MILNSRVHIHIQHIYQQVDCQIGDSQCQDAYLDHGIVSSLYGFYDVSDKEIFTNKDEMEKYDFGARLGMNTYF